MLRLFAIALLLMVPAASFAQTPQDVRIAELKAEVARLQAELAKLQAQTPPVVVVPAYPSYPYPPPVVIERRPWFGIDFGIRIGGGHHHHRR